MMADLVSVLSRFWLGMLTHLWQTTLILVLLFVVNLGMRRAPARLVHMVWISGLLKLFLPLALCGAALQAVGNRLFSGLTQHGSDMAIPTLSAIAAVLGAPREMMIGQHVGWLSSPSLIMGVTVIWGVGVLSLLGRLLRDIKRSALHTIVPSRDIGSTQRQKLEQALSRAGIPISAVHVCSQTAMPGVTGILRPRIFLPSRLVEELTHDELETILLHERAHQRRYDPFWALLQRLCSSFLFFYPLLPSLFRRLNESAEYACDEEITSSGRSSKTYSRALKRSMRLGLEPIRFSATILCGRESILRRRLDRLGAPGRFYMSARHRLFVVLAALLVAAGSFLPFPLHAEEGKETTKASIESSDELPAIDAHVEYDTPPEVKEFAPPKYPEKAKKEGITGTVVARLLIDTNGIVRDVQIVEGPEVFHESVEEAAYKAKFSPAKRDNKAVAVWVAVPFKFALDNK